MKIHSMIIFYQGQSFEIKVENEKSKPILTFDIYIMSTRQVVKKKITSTKRMLS